MAKARKKFKLPRGVEKARKKFGRALTRHRIVYEILVALLLIGILFFGMRGTLCLALRTGDPYRGVISDSMNHNDEVDRNRYIQQYGYDPYNVESWRDYFIQRGYDTSNFPIQGGFERGDLMFVQGVNPLEDIRIGDVIIYSVPYKTIPIVHRVVEISNANGEISFTTKGDNPYTNSSPDSPITPDKIIGRVVFVIPKLGYLSLWMQGQ